jgi:hypothetical protein
MQEGVLFGLCTPICTPTGFFQGFGLPKSLKDSAMLFRRFSKVWAYTDLKTLGEWPCRSDISTSVKPFDNKKEP